VASHGRPVALIVALNEAARALDPFHWALRRGSFETKTQCHGAGAGKRGCEQNCNSLP
jgi:antitoxin (DNA-binding transcriptional repressor) of toxin-antitoxin stability system